MTSYEPPKEPLTPFTIVADSMKYLNTQNEYFNHPIIKRFGSPLQPIYINPNILEINGIEYKEPLIFSINNAKCEHIQYAVFSDGQSIEVLNGARSEGFIYYGNLKFNKPIFITYGLEAFFKIAQTNCAVVLVVLPHLCCKKLKDLNSFDFTQIQFVIQQLQKEGYTKLYLPVRPEHIQLPSFQQLMRSTAVKLFNQYLKIGDAEFFIELVKEEPVENILEFIEMQLKQLSNEFTELEEHLVEPYFYGDGVFNLLKEGLFYVENIKGVEKKSYISSPIQVLAQTRDVTNNAWGRLIEWYDPDGVKHSQALSMELFQSDGVELRKALAYQGLIIASDGKSRNLLQSYLMNFPTSKRALCVNHVGWQGDFFVLPNQQIGKSENDELIVFQAKNVLDNSYQAKGTLVQWQNNVSRLIATHPILNVALCSAFAGSLLELLGQYTGAGLHFKGQSSKGKTTALYVGCSVWGKPNHYCKTWKSTGNALENTASLHNDGFLALDEIGEVATPLELGNIAYMLANGKGKARLTQNVTPKSSYVWKIIFLSTGEKSVREILQENGGKVKLGQEVRLIEVDITHSPYGVFKQIDFADCGAKQSKLLVENSNKYYGTAGISWLRYLTSNLAEIVDLAKKLLEQYHNELIAEHKQGHIIRVANIFALIAVAGELATQAGITGWNTGTAFNAVKEVFKIWIDNFKYVGDYQTSESILQVKSFLEAHGASRFEAITSDNNLIEKTINRVGYWKIVNGEKQFLVLPEQFKNVICKDLDSRSVAQILLKNNLLDHDSGKTSKTIRMPFSKTSLKVYAIKESIFGCSFNE